MDTVKAQSVPVNEDIPMEWWIAGGVALSVVLFAVLVAGLAIWKCRSKGKKDDKESLNVRTLYYVTRYSSSDTNDSPDGPNLEELVRPNVTACHVQPRHYSSAPSLVAGHHQRGLLTVTQPDVSGTSDEEEAQQVANTAGRIWFSFNYDDESCKLNITIVKARYLKGRTMTHESRDPFVRLYLLPDELHYLQSKARRRTLSPRFNETFTFELKPEEISSRLLKLSMYDIDRRNIRHSLGHCIVPLDKVDLGSGSIIWRNLETITQKPSQLGEILFSLYCNPYTDRLKVSVLRCRNLDLKRFNKDQTELFVRLELHYGPKMIKLKETTRYKLCESPNFFQNFCFSMSGRRLDSCSVALIVMASKDGGHVEAEAVNPKDCTPLGKVVVGSFLYARREQLQHWQEMMSNPRTATEKWHYLSEGT